LFEFIEELIKVFAVKDHARALTHGYELRTPHLIERASFDADVCHGFLMV